MERAPSGYATRKRSRAAVGANSVVPTRAKTAVRRYVKTCMKREAEKKHVTTSDSGIAPGATGTFGTSLVAMSQGSTAVTRVGAQINVIAVSCWGYATLPAASTGDLIRCILILDHQPNGANPAVTDVLEAANFLSPYNLDKVGSSSAGPARFRILADKTYDLNAPSAIVATGTATKYVHFRANAKVDLQVHYAGNAGTVSDLVKNNLIWLYLTGNASTTAVNVRSQICYTDV